MRREGRSIKKKINSRYQVKGSKYFSFAYPITNIDQVKFYLQFLKKEYNNASHICYAYRLLNQSSIDDFSTDAGEPRGSAGSPILNVLKSKEIINVVLLKLFLMIIYVST